MKKMALTISGVIHSFAGNPEMPLLWSLRDELHLTGTKFGCGEGLCEAYTVRRSSRACISNSWCSFDRPSMITDPKLDYIYDTLQR